MRIVLAALFVIVLAGCARSPEPDQIVSERKGPTFPELDRKLKGLDDDSLARAQRKAEMLGWINERLGPIVKRFDAVSKKYRATTDRDEKRRLQAEIEQLTADIEKLNQQIKERYGPELAEARASEGKGGQ